MVRFAPTDSALLCVRMGLPVPAPMVRDLQVPETFTVGWNDPIKFASPMITSVAELGIPAVQLEALFQDVLTVPFQLVCPIETFGMYKSNIANKKENNIFSAF